MSWKQICWALGRIWFKDHPTNVQDKQFSGWMKYVRRQINSPAMLMVLSNHFGTT